MICATDKNLHNYADLAPSEDYIEVLSHVETGTYNEDCGGIRFQCDAQG